MLGLTNPIQFRPICIGMYVNYPGSGQDEDCLFANVFAPANATAESKLPVWVFIQGGGYTSNANANWNGAGVVRRSGHNLVFVNFNYRVGLYGFLASERVRADGALNAGLLDQRFLLRWVQRHIAAFGGDPARVVVHGASAGAGSVALHLVAHGGRDDGLFVGAAAESVFLPAAQQVAALEWQFDLVSAAVGCAHHADELACLRARPTAALQATNVGAPFPGAAAPPAFYWTPCVDGDLLPDRPYRLFAAGRVVARAATLFGTDTDEGSVFAPDAPDRAALAGFFRNNFPRLSPAGADALVARYPRLPPLPRHARWFPSASRAYGEAVFTCPAVNMLTALARHAHANTSTTDATTSTAAAAVVPAGRHWGYRYDVYDAESEAAGMGVVHLFEAAAIFGPENIGWAPPSYWTYNAPIVPLVMDYWISFVRALDPNVYRNPAAPEWLEWDAAGAGAGGRRLLFRTGNLTVEETPRDQVERCDFWLAMGDEMEQ